MVGFEKLTLPTHIQRVYTQWPNEMHERYSQEKKCIYNFAFCVNE